MSLICVSVFSLYINSNDMKLNIIFYIFLIVIPLLTSCDKESNSSIDKKADQRKEQPNSSEQSNNSNNQQGIPEEFQANDILTIRVGGVNYKMVRVDGGSFTMGATSVNGIVEEGHSERSKPTHFVTLSTYYIGETEVTQGLWESVMGSNPSLSSDHYDNWRMPVEHVSWNDCQEFITKLNALTGRNFRLPTEAEWEFAARGGNKSLGYRFAGSNSLSKVATYNSHSPSCVGIHLPNELGLYDMNGNIGEWCQDWYGSYSANSQVNPTGPKDGSDRVRRGGSWADDEGDAFWPAWSRSYNVPIYVSNTVGFRLALSLFGDNPQLQLNKDNLTFTAAGHGETFNITSNTSWSITSDKSWCTLNTLSGSRNATVTVNVSENTSISSRTATITVTAGGIPLTITVTQAGIKSGEKGYETFTVNGVSFKMIRVEGGTFTMGATSEQGGDADKDESPSHLVTLSTYYIGETEVTQELWRAVMKLYYDYDYPSSFSGQQRPVERVNWSECNVFVTKLNTLTGWKFRLPTEAEWEFAARGGNKSLGYKYAGSNCIDDVAWYSKNAFNVAGDAYGTHPVAAKLPNELGLYDMSGNVEEWCQDWSDNYSSNSQTNPTGPESGYSRVIRGGSWGTGAKGCRVSNRSASAPYSHHYEIGLRLAL